jgi:hypothetical protein
MEKNTRLSGNIYIYFNDKTELTTYSTDIYATIDNIQKYGYEYIMGERVKLYPFHSIDRFEFRIDESQVVKKVLHEEIFEN